MTRALPASALADPHPDDGPVRRLRLIAGISQVELAHRLDCAQSTIAAWERPGTRLRHDTVVRVAAALGLPLAVLDEPWVTR